jgi:FAD/FMN-containing dehydrogenase
MTETDQVINYEVVLADGSIVQANKETNKDLFIALRGGGNNFGLVTRFDLQGYPDKKVWDAGGFRPLEATDAYVEAFVELGRRIDDKPDVAPLVTWIAGFGVPPPGAMILESMVQLDGDGTDPLLDLFNGIPVQRAPKSRHVSDRVADNKLISNK